MLSKAAHIDSIPALEIAANDVKAYHGATVGAIDAGGANLSTDRIVMVCFDGADKDVQLPEWKAARATVRFRQFGSFQLVYDSIAPVITPAGPLEGADLSHAGRIALRVSDNLGALRHFRAELDGIWLCFTNDKALDRAWALWKSEAAAG